MRLVLTLLNLDGTIKETKALVVRPSDWKRLRAPMLTGENLYRLKKDKKLEVRYEDGKLIYTLFEE